MGLENMNLALLSKWWWRFLSDSNHQWSPLIEGTYYTRRKPLKEGVLQTTLLMVEEHGGAF